MNQHDVIAAWDQADPKAIHPLRDVSEEAYWDSGAVQAAELARYLPRKGRILDYGCGDGRVAIPLHQRGYNIVAADTSPTMLAALTAREPGIKTALVEPMEPQPGGFDAAYCLAVLIHHDYADGADIIADIRDSVQPGGLLILDWPTSDNPTERHSWIGVTTWSVADQDALAKDLGLRRLKRSGLPFPAFRKATK